MKLEKNPIDGLQFLKELFFVLFLRTYTQPTQNIQLIISKHINKQHLLY